MPFGLRLTGEPLLAGDRRRPPADRGIRGETERDMQAHTATISAALSRASSTAQRSSVTDAGEPSTPTVIWPPAGADMASPRVLECDLPVAGPGAGELNARFSSRPAVGPARRRELRRHHLVHVPLPRHRRGRHDHRRPGAPPGWTCNWSGRRTCGGRRDGRRSTWTAYGRQSAPSGTCCAPRSCRRPRSGCCGTTRGCGST